MSHTLLLADDSTTIQRVVELTFANEDIDVVTVGDGAQAIEVIQRDAPDIVLADVSMPGKDGYEVASFIRSDPARARIPVVLLTGAFEPLDESRCDAIGRHEVIVKPFEPREMIGKVRELLGRPAETPSVPEAVEVAETVVADAPEAAVPDAPAAETEAAETEAAETEAAEVEAAEVEAVEAVVPDVSPAADAEAAPVGVPVAMPSEPAAAPAAEPTVDSSEPAAESAVDSFEPAAAPAAESAVDSFEPAAAPAAEPAVDSSEAVTAPPAGEAAPVAAARVPATGPGGSVLAQSFVTFLAVEQGAAPPVLAAADTDADSGGARPAIEITDAMMDDLVNRVVERLTDTVLRDTVAEVVSRIAERLARGEIARVTPGGE